MFNTGSRSTITKSVVESADSALESADSSADSRADPAKVGVWVRDVSVEARLPTSQGKVFLFQGKCQGILRFSGKMSNSRKCQREMRHLTFWVDS